MQHEVLNVKLRDLRSNIDASEGDNIEELVNEVEDAPVDRKEVLRQEGLEVRVKIAKLLREGAREKKATPARKVGFKRTTEKIGDVVVSKGKIHGKEVEVVDVDGLLRSLAEDDSSKAVAKQRSSHFQARVDTRYRVERDEVTRELQSQREALLASTDTTEFSANPAFKAYVSELDELPPYQHTRRVKEAYDLVRRDPTHLTPFTKQFSLSEVHTRRVTTMHGDREASHSPTSSLVAVPGPRFTDPFVIVGPKHTLGGPIRYGSKRWHDMVHGSTPLPVPDAVTKDLSLMERGYQ